jgi:putative membrane protein
VAVLLVLGLVFLFSRAAFGGTRGYGIMFSFFPGGFGILGVFWVFLIIALPVFLLWPSSRWQDGDSSQQHDGALLILRERYAKGEITKEQFDQMMRDLMPKSQ